MNVTTALKAPKSRIEVNSQKEAWAIIDSIFPTDYMKDEECSVRAGYPIYRSTAEGHYYDYICDLNDRYEINLSNGKTVNVWFTETYWQVRQMAETIRELKAKIEDLNTEIFFLNEEKKSLIKKNESLQSDYEDIKYMSGCYQSKVSELEEKMDAIRKLLN